MVLGVDDMLVSLGWGVEQPKVYLVLLLLSITHWSSKKTTTTTTLISKKTANKRDYTTYYLGLPSANSVPCILHIHRLYADISHKFSPMLQNEGWQHESLIWVLYMFHSEFSQALSFHGVLLAKFKHVWNKHPETTRWKAQHRSQSHTNMNVLYKYLSLSALFLILIFFDVYFADKSATKRLVSPINSSGYENTPGKHGKRRDLTTQINDTPEN